MSNYYKHTYKKLMETTPESNPSYYVYKNEYERILRRERENDLERLEREKAYIYRNAKMPEVEDEKVEETEEKPKRGRKKKVDKVEGEE